MNSKSVHQAEKLTDAELSKKPGRYQFIEALLSFCDCISHCRHHSLNIPQYCGSGNTYFRRHTAEFRHERYRRHEKILCVLS